MIKKGMTLKRVIGEIQKKYAWLKFVRRIDFDNGEVNLFYTDGVGEKCLCFDKEHKLRIILNGSEALF